MNPMVVVWAVGSLALLLVGALATYPLSILLVALGLAAAGLAVRQVRVDRAPAVVARVRPTRPDAE